MALRKEETEQGSIDHNPAEYKGPNLKELEDALDEESSGVYDYDDPETYTYKDLGPVDGSEDDGSEYESEEDDRLQLTDEQRASMAQNYAVDENGEPITNDEYFMGIKREAIKDGADARAILNNEAAPWTGQDIETVDNAPLELDFDPSTYEMLHRMTPEWPCLSFDFAQDSLPNNRSEFPKTFFAVAGTQAPRDNQLYIMKLDELHKTQNDGKEAAEVTDFDLDDDPSLTLRRLRVPSPINRVRCSPFLETAALCAVYCDNGLIYLYDINNVMRELGNETPALPTTKVLSSTAAALMSKNADKIRPIATLDNHNCEGFALGFSPIDSSILVSGDTNGKLIVWKMNGQKNKIFVEPIAKPVTAHNNTSIEDVAFAPVISGQSNIFSTVGCDGTLAIWDMNNLSAAAARVKISDHDVNVLSWDPVDYTRIACGCDDGSWVIVSLPALLGGQDPIVKRFTYHKAAITSIEFHPVREGIVAISSEDNTVTIWDLGMVADEEADQTLGENLREAAMITPDELLFVHRGQNNIKELHWHRQVKDVLMTTAEDSFNILCPFNLEEINDEEIEEVANKDAE